MTEENFTINRETLEVITQGLYRATPDALYQAYTDKEQIPRWWGPDTIAVEVDQLDTRVGGSWRFIYSVPGQEPVAWSGIYQELDPPRKLVSTFVFEPNPGHVHIGTVLFEDRHDGTTKVTEILKFMHISDLDEVVASNIAEGQTERQARLAKLTEQPNQSSEPALA